jgi:hypothetical protein
MLRGALAGAAAAGVWAAQQPLDKKVFGVDYDDAELLGSVVTRDRGAAATLPVGGAMHVLNGALFGALYSRLAPALPGPRIARGVAAGLAECVATWPATRLMHLHPAGSQFPQLYGSHRAFAQAVWRHALFGALLGELERRLNPPEGEAAPTSDAERATTNGHGNVEHLVVARSA